MTEAQKLAAEYRHTMPAEVLHLWAPEATAELRRLDAEYRELSERHEVQAQNYMALAAECEQLRADAARYRWLVARPLNGEDEFYISAQDSIQANADGWWALGGDMSKSVAEAKPEAQQLDALTEVEVELMFRSRKAQPVKGQKDPWYWYAWGVEDGERAHGIGAGAEKL